MKALIAWYYYDRRPPSVTKEQALSYQWESHTFCLCRIFFHVSMSSKTILFFWFWSDAAILPSACGKAGSVWRHLNELLYNLKREQKRYPAGVKWPGGEEATKPSLRLSWTTRRCSHCVSSIGLHFQECCNGREMIFFRGRSEH